MLGLFLAKRVTEHVEETVRISLGQALNKLVAMPNERCRALLFVAVQCHAIQGKSFDRPNGAARRSGIRLYGDGGFGFEFRSWNPAGDGIRSQLKNLLIVGWRRPDNTNQRTDRAIAINTGNGARQPLRMSHAFSRLAAAP